MATQEVYGRKYSLRIGKVAKLAPEQVIVNAQDFSNISVTVTGGSLVNNSTQGGYRDYVTIPLEDDVVEISELHIETTVETSVTSKSSLSGSSIKIKIFNLSPETLKRIKTEDSVILRAGYEQDEELPLMFAAQVISMKTKREGANLVTTLICGDSFTPRKNLRVSKSYPKGTSKRQIIEDLLLIAADYGVPTGSFFVPSSELETGLSSIISTSNYNPAKGFAAFRVDSVATTGYTVFGLLFEQLAKVCDDIDFRSYLLQGSLYVEPIEYRTKQTTVEVTGESLIGSIKEEDEGSTNLSGDALKQRGITLKVPLNGRITTTSLIKVSEIEEEELSGDYSVEKIKHTANLEVGEWVTEISCKRVS